MKELSIIEVQEVSGAGKIQDALSNAYGNFFLHATETLNKIFGLGYETEAAQKTGQDFGSKLGQAIETGISDILTRIKTGLLG